MKQLFTVVSLVLAVSLLGCGGPKQRSTSLLNVPPAPVSKTDSLHAGGQLTRSDAESGSSNFHIDGFAAATIGDHGIAGVAAGYGQQQQSASAATTVPQLYYRDQYGQMVPYSQGVIPGGLPVPGYAGGAPYPFGNRLTIIFVNNLDWNVDVAVTHGRQRSPLGRIPPRLSLPFYVPDYEDYTFLITGKGGSDTPTVGVDYSHPVVFYNIGAPRLGW